MDQLVNGKWGASRWEELLERSQIFVSESGLLNDSLRLELLNEVEEMINKLNLDLKPLLCLLGKSLVIVPKDVDASNEIDSDSLINQLKKAGFNTVRTKVGKLF